MKSIGSNVPFLLACCNFPIFSSVENLLSQQGVAVCKVKTEAALLVQAENNPPPSLVLLSAERGVASVVGICHTLKKKKITADIPICVLLTDGAKVNRSDIFQSGAMEILELAWGAQEINLRLMRHLRAETAHCSSANNADLQKPLSHGQKLVWAAQQVLESSANGLLTQRELARQLGTSEYRLNAAFRYAHGLSVYEYLRTHTLRGAMELLADKQLQVQEIAELCGYSDTASFTTAFRRLMGMPPTAYRKSISQKKLIKGLGMGEHSDA